MSPWKLCPVLLLAVALAHHVHAGSKARSHALSCLHPNSTWRLCRDLTDRARFTQLLRPLLVERIVGTPQHRVVGEYLKSTLSSLGWHTEWDSFHARTPLGRRNFRTLIATSHVAAPRRLTLACHYDSKIIKGHRMIAATDSAVPCAMMLDIATTLSPYMYRRAAQDVALQLIFFDGEEAFGEWSSSDSIYGARHLAAKWAKTPYAPALESSRYATPHAQQRFIGSQLDRIDVIMLLDLLGAPAPTIRNSAGYGAEALFGELANTEQELRALNCHRQLPPATGFQPLFLPQPLPQIVEDDHLPFLQRGVPILHVISTPFPAVWHQPSDDAAAIDLPTIDYLTAIVRVFVAKYLGIAPL